MRIGSPFDALHEAIASATHKDLPDIEYWNRDWMAYRKLSKDEQARLRPGEGPGETRKRRPGADEVEIVMFPQTWSSTALGYGGMGGAAMTPAYTVIVSDMNMFCVYFGCGRLAYAINGRKQSPEGRERFRADMTAQSMAHCGDEERYQ